MSAHVLLNLSKELGKRDKMQGLPSILSLFLNEFNKFNNIRARMLDSIYHMTLRFLWNFILGVKSYNFVIMYAMLLWTSKHFPKICKPLVVYRFYCMELFHSQTRHHMINALINKHNCNKKLILNTVSLALKNHSGSGSVLDSRPRGRRFEPHRCHCVVVLEQDTFILA